MTNGEVVRKFADVCVLAPELALSALQEALKGKYDVTFTKIVPPVNNVAEEHIYQFPFMTGEKGVVVK